MYEKHNWVNGEVISEDKLNHMEDGIANAGGALILTEDATGTLNHTWEEIKNAIMSGMRVGMGASIEGDSGTSWDFFDVGSAEMADNSYAVGPMHDKYYVTDSPTGYPRYTGD